MSIYISLMNRLSGNKRVRCDEICAFCYAKQKNVSNAKKAPAGAGDVWTWTAIDADNKFAVSWLVGAMPRMRTSSRKTWRVV